MYLYLSFQIKDHYAGARPMLEHSVTHNSTISQDFSKRVFRVHFSTLNFLFFITFILSYAIFNLQLSVSSPYSGWDFSGLLTDKRGQKGSPP